MASRKKPLSQARHADGERISKAYKTAMDSPTAATVTALQETWIDVVQSWMTAALKKGMTE